MTHWLESHLRALLFAVGELLRAPISSLMTLLVIGIAMAFPAGLYALLQNLQQLTKQWHHNPTISVYLKPQVTETQVNMLMAQVQQRNDVEHVSYISPEQGLKEFEDQTGLQAALQTLSENPLPGILVITPKLSVKSQIDIQKLLLWLRQSPSIDASHLENIWIMRLYQLMTLSERFTYALMLLFGIGVALIVGNTMRLATQSHRQEILLMKLIGATPAFIRRPMLYRGALYGLFGGLLSCILVSMFFLWLQNPIEQLAATYHNPWHLQALSYLDVLVIVGCCAFLGLIGSWFSVQQYLQTPEEV